MNSNSAKHMVTYSCASGYVNSGSPSNILGTSVFSLEESLWRRLKRLCPVPGNNSVVMEVGLLKHQWSLTFKYCVWSCKKVMFYYFWWPSEL